MYGINTWWIMYLYIWPLLVILAYLFRNIESVLFWAIFAGIFGLCFGMLCSLTYFFIGMQDGGIIGGFNTAFPWWISGIMWDMVHCAGNFVLMLVLYYPIGNLMKRMDWCNITYQNWDLYFFSEDVSCNLYKIFIVDVIDGKIVVTEL